MEFPEFFEALRLRADLTQAAFGKRVGVSAGYVNQIVKRKVAPLPIGKIDKWAEALGLQEPERKEELKLFKRLAHLEHSTHEIRGLVRAQESEMAKLKEEVFHLCEQRSVLMGQVADLRAKVASILSKRPKVRSKR